MSTGSNGKTAYYVQLTTLNYDTNDSNYPDGIELPSTVYYYNWGDYGNTDLTGLSYKLDIAENSGFTQNLKTRYTGSNVLDTSFGPPGFHDEVPWVLDIPPPLEVTLSGFIKERLSIN